MVEIFVAYIKDCSAYRIVTPYKTITKVMNCDCDETVLSALKATRAKNITLITKSNMYELLCKGIGVEPRDEVQEAICTILGDKKVIFERIDEDSQRQLVEVMKAELENEKVKKEQEPVVLTNNSEIASNLDEVVFDLESDEEDEKENEENTDVDNDIEKINNVIVDGGADPFS